jgi:hypothetical protein
MFRKLILSASLGLSALATLAPTAASAQRYGSWNAPYGSADGYQDRRYDDRRDYDDRGRYLARQRWIAHHRWEQEERRREWQREHWRGGDDRRDGWNQNRRRGDHHGDY